MWGPHLKFSLKATLYFWKKMEKVVLFTKKKKFGAFFLPTLGILAKFLTLKPSLSSAPILNIFLHSTNNELTISKLKFRALNIETNLVLFEREGD